MKSPAGYKPGNKAGWNHAVLDPGTQRVKAENKDLKERLATLEEMVNGLTNKKPKKSA